MVDKIINKIIDTLTLMLLKSNQCIKINTMPNNLKTPKMLALFKWEAQDKYS